MAQTVIGLDIGSWSIKAAVFESTLRGFTLVDVVEHRIPRTPEGVPAETDLSDLVSATLKSVADHDTLATSVSGGRVMSREVELPFSDERRVRSVLGFQLEGKLPANLDDLVYDYTLIEEDEDRALLFCPAVDRAWLASFLESLKTGDADPRVVTLSPLGYGRLLHHLGVGTDEVIALVDIGHEETTVSMVSGGIVRLTRTIGRGGHQVTLALAEALDLDYGEAEKVKHQGVRLEDHRSDGADTDQDGLEQHPALIVSEALAPTLRDIRLTLHAQTQRLGTSIDRIYLFGGTCRLPGVQELVARNVDAPVQVPVISRQPWSELAMDPLDQMSIPAAVGLGLRLVDEANGETLNFRQGDLAYESDFKALRDKAGFLTVITLILLSAFFGRQIIELQALEANHGALTAALEAFSEAVIGEPKDDFEYVKQRLLMPVAKSDEKVYPDISAFRSFYDVTTAQNTVNAIPPKEDEGESEGSADPDDAEDKSGFEVELKQIQADLRTLFVKGEANDIEAVEAFTAELKKNRCFSEVETNDTTRISFGDRQDWLRFQLKVEVACADPAVAKKKGDKPTGAEEGNGAAGANGGGR